MVNNILQDKSLYNNLEIFSTLRLNARRVKLSDKNLLCTLHANEEVGKTMGGIKSRHDTCIMLQKFLDHWEKYGFGVWVFRDKSTGAFVGRCGLQTSFVTDRREVELLYALMPEFWGKGLATEIVRNLVTIGFDELNLDEIIGYTLTSNLASKRVMEKLNFCCESIILHIGLPHYLFRLKRNGNA